MVAISLLVLVAKLLLEVLARLSPLLPIPLVLFLEWCVVSKYEFSRAGLVIFRAAYLICVLAAVFLTYTLGMIFWN